MLFGNIYTFNEGSKQVDNIKKGDVIYDGINNKNVIINDVSKKYEKVLTLNIYKTRPIQLGYHNKVLTLHDMIDEPQWTYVSELTINHYVAMTTKKLSKDESNNEDKFLLMGIYITCGKIEDNKLIFTLKKYLSLYDYNEDNTNGDNISDYNIVIKILLKLFNIYKHSLTVSNNNNILTIDITNQNELIDFINNIDNEILNIDNNYNLHQLILGMHFNNKYSKYESFVNCKSVEDANKYYNILRNYGLDIRINNSLLEFNSIYAVNLNVIDPNDPVVCCNNCCIIDEPHKYNYKFLKVISVVDERKYKETLTFDISNKYYNVENIIFM